MTAAAQKYRFPLSAQILVAMILGAILGTMLGTSAAPMGEIGKLIIQLIKAVATPLLFFAIVHAAIATSIEARAGAKMVSIAAFNATVALVIGLSISNLLEPGKHLQLTARGSAEVYAEKKIDFLKTFISYIPENFVEPFEKNAVIGVVLLALLIGFGLRRVSQEQRDQHPERSAAIETASATLLRTFEIVMAWVIKLIPLGVLGVVAKVVGEYGFSPLRGLAVYVGVGLLGLFLHVAITHQAWIFFYAKRSLREFWLHAREPVIYGIGSNSSLATLPVTLRALDRLGVSRSSSALGACVGTNFNNDGIILYEGMAVLFVAQASGIDLSFGQQVLAALSCMVAAMGVAGVPEAGFISLALVLNTVGLPVELLPLLLTVDWIVARGRTVANVTSDMVLSIAIDKR